GPAGLGIPEHLHPRSGARAGLPRGVHLARAVGPAGPDALLAPVRPDRRRSGGSDLPGLDRPDLVDLRLRGLRDHRPQHVGLSGVGPGAVRAPAPLAGARTPVAGLRPEIPAVGAGRLVAGGRLLPHGIRPDVVGARLHPCAAARPRHPHGVGLRGGDLAVPRAGLLPADPDGELVGGGALRHLPAPGLDRRILDPVRQSFLQPVPRALHRLPLRLDPALRHARGDHPRHRPLRLGARSGADAGPRHRARALHALLALDHGLRRLFREHPPLALLVRHPLPDHRRHRHPVDRYRGGQLVSLGDQAGLRTRLSRRVSSAARPRPTRHRSAAM
ncbi:MAG: Photosynthetic reaction center M subunit, partial [uncultured Acetobacteraceae bacterium]